MTEDESGGLKYGFQNYGFVSVFIYFPTYSEIKDLSKM